MSERMYADYKRAVRYNGIKKFYKQYPDVTAVTLQALAARLEREIKAG